MNDEIRVEDYQNMLYKLAWSFNRTTGLPFEDLLSSAYLAFAHSRKSFDKTRGCFSTYLYHAARTRLVDHCNSAYYYKGNNVEKLENPQPQAPYLIEAQIKLSPEELELQDPESKIVFKEALYALSKDARSVCEMIFESPHEFLTHAPKLSRGKVKNKLRESGWSWGRIWSSFSEIKSLINEI